jgi:hypothetical protein
MTTPKAAISSAKTQGKRPADFTGKLQQKLAEDKKSELVEAAQRVAMVTAVAADIKDNEIIDLTNSDEPLPVPEVREVEVNSPNRIIRVNSDLPMVTFGREVLDPGDPETGRPAIMGPMNMYNFEEGQQYRVPRELADHLQQLGYLSYYGGV